MCIIRWFGGEPLLRPDLIDRICGGLREAGLNYRSTMITNGSLITLGIIHKMKDDWHRITDFLEDAKNAVTQREKVRLYFAPL